MSAVCPNCSSSIAETAKLCVACGYDLEEQVLIATEFEAEDQSSETHLPRETGFIDEVVFPMLWRYLYFFVAGFLVSFVLLLVMYAFVIATQQTASSSSADGVTMTMNFFMILFYSGVGGFVVGLVALAFSVLYWLTADSPELFWGISAVAGVTALILVFAFAWDGFWEWAGSMPDKRRR